jgi:hypothetical protein
VLPPAAPTTAADSFWPPRAVRVPAGRNGESAASPESNRGTLGRVEGGPFWPDPLMGGKAGIIVPPERWVAAPKKPHSGGPGPAYAPPMVGGGPDQSITMAMPLGAVVAGSMVLASLGAGDGWWEADVLEVHDDLLTLRWRDCPDEPSFVRRKSQIALLFPTL